ncbi:MAG: AMP-binding protein [Actinomycetia bacterium]|nr:AMP-binding protein [Actinomycetes bacterium]
MPTTRGFRTIPALLARAAAEHGDRPWLVTDDGTRSFADAAAVVGAVGHRLRDLGVVRGDIVALTARNDPDHLLAILGVTATGGIAVPLDPRSTDAELRGLLGQLAAGGRLRAMVTDAGLRDTVHRAWDGPGPPPWLADVAELVAGPHPHGAVEVPVEQDDVAVMIPTSGTTGRSKLVMQTHCAHVMSGEGFPAWLGLGRDDRLMTALPLFHTNALAYSTMGSLACGAGLVLLPRFSASGFLDVARRHGATTFNAVGAMLEMLEARPARADDAGTPLRVAYSAPSPPAERHRAFEERFGLRLVCGYGMSESVYGLIWRPGTRPFGTLGCLRQHPELGVVNHARVVADDRAEVPPGAPGALLLRHPTVTPGYFGLPEETAEALRDGWLHTGDLVTTDGVGTYTFVARKKEVIRRRGENLAPAEVADAVRAHPDVADCVVIGVPAGMAEEEVKAYVVLAPRARATATDLQRTAAQLLAPYKVPRFWQFVEEFPRTPTGRVVVRALPGPEHGEIDLARPRGATG